MALRFQPYVSPETFLSYRDAANQRPDYLGGVNRLAETIQGIGSDIQAKRMAAYNQNRQSKLDQILLAEEKRKELESSNKYGSPIDPNIDVGQPSNFIGNTRSFGPVNTGTPVSLSNSFNAFRAGGMKPSEARPEYIPALAEDERKKFYENANPKPNDMSLDEMLANKVKSGEMTIEEAYKIKSSGQAGSFMLGGIGGNGQPIFYNTKDPNKVVTAPVPGGGTLYPKTPSDAQMNASLFGKRAGEANIQLEKLSGNPNFDPTSIQTGVERKLPNLFQSSNVQALEQAKRNFVAAVLRKESGALISDDEMKQADLQYFPQAGDQPEVLRQKALNRQTAIEGLNKMAGPLTSPPNQVNGGDLMWNGRPLKDTPANRAWLLQQQGGQK